VSGVLSVAYAVHESKETLPRESSNVRRCEQACNENAPRRVLPRDIDFAAPASPRQIQLGSTQPRIRLELRGVAPLRLYIFRRDGREVQT
jgi:hypothetical protein